jgi:hypothetical protein
VRRTAAGLKGKAAVEKLQGCARRGRRAAFTGAMNFSEFLRIEREGSDGSRHFVVHTSDPKMTLELSPDRTAPDQMGRGVIKHVHVPNSWAGDYTKYSQYLSAAQDFFEQSRAEPGPISGPRRFPA